MNEGSHSALNGTTFVLVKSTIKCGCRFALSERMAWHETHLLEVERNNFPSQQISLHHKGKIRQSIKVAFLWVFSFARCSQQKNV
jgi:hypothetical protein